MIISASGGALSYTKDLPVVKKSGVKKKLCCSLRPSMGILW